MKGLVLLAVVLAFFFVNPLDAQWGGGGGGGGGGNTATIVSTLKKLYESTNGPSWTMNYGWLDKDPCNNYWQGITCDGTQVTEVWLADNGLTGSIPADFWDLPGLQEVFLQNNRITGTLPRTFGRGNTWYLELSNNQFSGTIPNNFVAHGRWGHLNMSNNRFTGQVPDSLLNLVANYAGEVDVHGNYFTCPLPAFCKMNVAMNCGSCGGNAPGGGGGGGGGWRPGQGGGSPNPGQGGGTAPEDDGGVFDERPGGDIFNPDDISIPF